MKLSARGGEGAIVQRLLDRKKRGDGEMGRMRIEGNGGMNSASGRRATAEAGAKTEAGAREEAREGANDGASDVKLKRGGQGRAQIV